MPSTSASATPVLVTGAAGFIGFHLSQRLLRDGRPVVGVDVMNDRPARHRPRVAIRAFWSASRPTAHTTSAPSIPSTAVSDRLSRVMS